MTTAHHELAGLFSAASKWSVRHGEAAAASRHIALEFHEPLDLASSGYRSPEGLPAAEVATGGQHLESEHPEM